MIFAIRSNVNTFRTVELQPGFNVILADRTKDSGERDSRNGLGKTTLIEILHFCLGASTRKGQGLLVTPLTGWTFTVDMSIDGRELSVTRSIDDPHHVHLEGDVRGLAIRNDRTDGTVVLTNGEWTSILGELFFGLRPAPDFKYQPTFRSLLSYLIRRGRDAFATPFGHHRSQQEWDKQVNNAYLLGLAWQHASRLQELRDEANLLNSLRRAAGEGLLEGMIGTVGNLEAERARVDTEIRTRAESLAAFRVHPQYEELQSEADELTSSIQDLTNANLMDERLSDLYRTSLEATEAPNTDEVLDVYQAIGINMPDMVRRRIDEVQHFHQQLLDNRTAYLESELQRLQANLNQRRIQRQEHINRRARLLEVLRTHGALQEYTSLQELHLGLVAKQNDLEHRINNLKRFESGRSEVRVKRELLLQTARREFEERRHVREQAIYVFNKHSQELYEAPGNLVVNVLDTGFRFDVEIMRSGSQGINNMKIFCYDHTLAQLWGTRRSSVGLLIHDSTIFDGVDERQIALALQLAYRESEQQSYQYVCAMNSDTVPSGELPTGFDIARFVRLRLTDESEEGGLLGIRY